VFGLATSNPDTAFGSMEYAIRLRTGGYLEIYESNVRNFYTGPYAIGDVISIDRNGTTITYRQNGIRLYESTAPSTGDLLVDTSIQTPDSSISNAQVYLTQVVNQLPTANAGVDQIVNEGVVVNLDGTSSSDADGTIASYSWAQTAGPAVTLTGANSATPNFTALSITADTVLTFELTVTDNDGAIATDSVDITVQNVNQLPIANAGVDQAVNEGSVVNLDGTGSSDSDGTINVYSWSQTAGPVVTLAGANTASPNFTAPSVATDTVLTFELTVTDNDGAIATDSVDITVQNVNQLPAANAGIDQTVNENDSVNLDGTASSDSDGSITTYSWTQVAGPVVTLTGATTATPGFTAPAVTTDTALIFELTVTDNNGGNATDTVVVTVQNVNQLPTANAGVDQTVNEGDSVNLDGSSSTDSDGSISSYNWIQTGGPSVTITGATSATPGFTAPAVTADTVLTFELTVTDNDSGNASDTVVITIQNVNQLPTANAGTDQTVAEGAAVNLIGSGNDTDGSIVAYSWIQTSGTSVTLNNANTANASFTAPTVSADEILVFELTVTDNDGANATDSISITVQNNNQSPTADAGVDQTVDEGTAVNLAGNGTDPDGSISSYAWTQIAGPLVSLINENTANASFTAINVDVDTLVTFQLTVTDNDGANATDTVNVTIQNVNQLPVANAGTDQAVNEGDTVNLDGTASSDSDGSISSYSWTQTGGPAVILTGANTATAGFTAPQVSTDTVLTFVLSIIDNAGGNATDTVVVTVQNVNQLPTANAGVDQTVNEGVTVNLDGTASSDIDGSITAYNWVQTAGPAVVINGGNTAMPSFTAPQVTTDTVLTFELTVTDNDGANAIDTVMVTVQNVNQLPVANAGVDQAVNESSIVSLDGSASSDSDGTIISYSWIQTSGPAVTLSGAGTATPGFTAPAVTVDTSVTFELTVTDNDGGNATDSVVITIQNVNQLPVAAAGADQVVNEGDPVSLDGTASSDSDGSIVVYSWTQSAGPAVTITGANTATPGFTAPDVTTATDLTFELTVTDNDGGNATDTISVTVQNVNQLPVASAGIDQTVNESDAVVLDGSASSDSDGTIASFNWVQTAGPAVSLTGANTAIAGFVAPDVAADSALSFELTVTDNNGGVATDTVVVNVLNVNQLPLANAGLDQTVNEGSLVNLDGTGSSDVDGTIATYSWTQTSGPVVTVTGANTATPSFSAPTVSVETILSFELTVTDNDGANATDTVNVTVQNVNQLPTANAGVDQTVNEGVIVSLEGTASSDADGSISGYSWSQIAGPAVVVNGATTATPDFMAPTVTADTLLTFVLTVTDNDGANATDTINVTVQNVNQLPTANAGSDQTANEGQNVTLDGTASSDIDGTISSYSWVQTDGPSVTLTGANTATPGFVAPVVTVNTTLTFELTVTDNEGAIATDFVVVTVMPANQLPVANAGPDQTVNERTGRSNTVVYLDATGSSDPDGSITSYSWTQILGPTVVLTDANTATPSFTAPRITSDTLLEFQVTVTDNSGASSNDTVQITEINQGRTIGLAPYAPIGPDNGSGVSLASIENSSGDTAVRVSSSLQSKTDESGKTAKSALLIVQKQLDGHSHEPVTFAANYDVYRNGLETGYKWQQTAEDPNSYDRPETVYFVSGDELSVWRTVDKDPETETASTTVKHVVRDRIPFDAQAFVASLDHNQDKSQVGKYIKVSHGTASSPVSFDSEVWSYRYDANGNIEDIVNSAGNSVYTYDALDRVIEETRPGQSTETLDYDRNGNRTAKTVDAIVDTYGYITNSNQLNSDPIGAIAHDNAGNRTSDKGGNRTFEYNEAGRLYRVYEGGSLLATYVYNAQGQRTRKITDTVTTVYHYDLAGNLISETTDAGVAIKDYVHMNSVPVAQIDTDGVNDSVSYLHTDHLGTPRRATDEAGNVVWAWESDAFGTTAANEDPDNDSTATIINLRFAGQYYDAETALHYNYFRYYDPNVGRYISSDPIGLVGGPNTYGYGFANPLTFTDRLGLLPPDPAPEGCEWEWKHTWWEKSGDPIARAVGSLKVRSKNCYPVPLPEVTGDPQPNMPDPRNPDAPPISLEPFGQIQFSPNFSTWICFGTLEGTFDVYQIEKQMGTYNLKCEECGGTKYYPGGSARPTGAPDREQFLDRVHDVQRATWIEYRSN